MSAVLLVLLLHPGCEGTMGGERATGDGGDPRPPGDAARAVTDAAPDAAADGDAGPTTADADVPDPPPPTDNPFRAEGLIPAFPGAEGHGALALDSCDRSDVQVLTVTSLADDGEGTLREVLTRVDPDRLTIVRFEVAGYIDVESRIEAPREASCVYIAGQTAPGDGITLRGNNGLSFRRGQHDVAIRHLRSRLGFHGDRRGHVGIYLAGGEDLIVDHVSVSWTTDKLLVVLVNGYEHVRRVSVQRSVFSEVLAAHPTAMQITGEDAGATDPERRDEWRSHYDITVHHNLLAHNSHRNSASNSAGYVFANNVVYNWRQGATQAGHVQDIVNNRYVAGPMTDDRFLHEVVMSRPSSPEFAELYVSGNVGPHNDDALAGADAQWRGSRRVVACYYKCRSWEEEGLETGDPLPLIYRRDSPLPAAEVPVTLDTAPAAHGSLVTDGDVGDNARVGCDGRWIPRRDGVDERVLTEARTGTGITAPPDDEHQVGGYPPLEGGEPCTDGDGDGMPDAFELRHGLSIDDAGDASLDPDDDGYTNVEEYVNGTTP